MDVSRIQEQMLLKATWKTEFLFFFDRQLWLFLGVKVDEKILHSKVVFSLDDKNV